MQLIIIFLEYRVLVGRPEKKQLKDIGLDGRLTFSILIADFLV
jgi:hypothetical protein